MRKAILNTLIPIVYSLKSWVVNLFENEDCLKRSATKHIGLLKQVDRGHPFSLTKGHRTSLVDH